MANDPSRTYRNLALIGFMGSGKSSVGQMVAAHLRFEFLDTDNLIESSAGKSISQIFENEGEPAFRALEKRVVRELSQRHRTVISTGGGLGADPDNLNELKRHALVVCLWAAPEVLWKRVRHQSHRPLLQEPDGEQHVRDLLHAREPVYRQADVLINSGLRPIREVALQVIHHFEQAQSPSSSNA